MVNAPWSAEQKYTKTPDKPPERAQNRMESRLNGDTAVAFVMTRSRFGEGIGTCGVTHSSGLQTSLTRQGSDLPANPPDRSLFGCITTEFPTTELLCKSAFCPVNDVATSNCGLLQLLIAVITQTGPSISEGAFKISVKAVPL